MSGVPVSAALEGQVVIVTGASRGIGKGLALGLGAAGAVVVCAARADQPRPGAAPATTRTRTCHPGFTTYAVAKATRAVLDDPRDGADRATSPHTVCAISRAFARTVS